MRKTDRILSISGFTLLIVSFVTVQMIWLTMSQELSVLWNQQVGFVGDVLWITLLSGIIFTGIAYYKNYLIPKLWNLFYLWRAPWDIGGPRPELEQLVESGKSRPCRAIDLGCGEGDNVIYLAQQGFDVTGVDISSRAITRARRKAQAAGVSPTFLVGDVADLKGVDGPFDLVVDNGCMHTLFGDRDAYVQTVLRLTRPGSRYFLRCFLKKRRFRLRGTVEPDEVERRFGGDFDIEDLEPLPPGLAIDAVYLMTRQ